MNDCPSLEQFRQLLDDQLPDPEREPLETHVDACPRCQETLARLTDEPGLPEFQNSVPVGFLRQLPTSTNDAAQGSGIVFPGPASELASISTVADFACARRRNARISRVFRGRC